MNLIKEISKVKNLNKYDIEHLFKIALEQELKNKSSIYFGSNLKTDYNKTIKENFNININRVKEIFGSCLEFEKVRSVNFSEIYFKDYEGSEYRKAERTLLKGNSIINFKGYNLYLGLYGIVDKLYNLISLLTEDKNLNNYSEINQYLEEHDLKKDVYNKFGKVELKEFSIKLYQNGRIDITFKDIEKAIKFYNEFKRIQEKKYKIHNWKF